MLRRPREVFPQRLHSPRKEPLRILAFGIGITHTLLAARNDALGDYMPMWVLVLLSIPIGYISGQLWFILVSRLLGKSAEMMGGRRNDRATYRVAAWGSLPTFYAGLVLLFAHALMSPSIFQQDFYTDEFSIPTRLFVVAAHLGWFIAVLWSVVLTSIGAGIVAGFSAWKGFASYLLSILLFIGLSIPLTLICGVVLYVVFWAAIWFLFILL